MFAFLVQGYYTYDIITIYFASEESNMMRSRPISLFLVLGVTLLTGNKLVPVVISTTVLKRKTLHCDSVTSAPGACTTRAFIMIHFLASHCKTTTSNHLNLNSC